MSSARTAGNPAGAGQTQEGSAARSPVATGERRLGSGWGIRTRLIASYATIGASIAAASFVAGRSIQGTIAPIGKFHLESFAGAESLQMIAIDAAQKCTDFAVSGKPSEKQAFFSHLARFEQGRRAFVDLAHLDDPEEALEASFLASVTQAYGEMVERGLKMMEDRERLGAARGGR